MIARRALGALFLFTAVGGGGGVCPRQANIVERLGAPSTTRSGKLR